MTNIVQNATYANELHSKLIEGNSFDIPNIDFTKPPFNWVPGPDSPLNKEVDSLTTESLTERKFKGKGVFDALMESTSNHIKEELREGRIAKNDYAQAWVSLTEACMVNAVAFLVQKDTAYWNAVATQMQSKTALIGLEVAKIGAASQYFDAKTSEANFANTKMNTLNQESAYSTSEWNLKDMLPAQKELVIANKGNVTSETDINKFRVNEQLPTEVNLTKKNIDAIKAKIDLDEYQLTDMSPTQKEMLLAQVKNEEISYSISDWNLTNRLPVDKDLVEANIANVSAETGLTQFRISDQLPSEVELIKKNTDAVVVKTELDEFDLTSTKPTQVKNIEATTKLVDSQTANQKQELTTNTWLLKERLPVDKEMVEKQIKNQEVAFDSATYTLTNLLPAQLVLTVEQGESQRAQTLDSRSDGQTVKGSIGKQKDLYTQQIDSYQRDAEYKVGKFYVDAFITMKTIDEGLKAPDNFTNANIDKVLNSLKSKVNI